MVMFLYYLINAYTWVICIYVLLSWVPELQQRESLRQVYEVLGKMVEPLLGSIRSVFPRSRVDFSPIIAILALTAISRLLLYL